MAEQRSVTYKIRVDTSEGKKLSEFETTLQSIGGTSKQAEASMQKLADSLSINGQKATVAVDGTKEYRQELTALNKEALKNHKAMNALTDEYAHLSSRLGKTADEQEVLNAQQRLGKNATKAQKDEVERLVTAYQKNRTEANKTQGSMRGLRGQAQNLGWQLQDVAVQAQAGTDGLIILGQQGSQLASGFGATGALVGAGIAVGAAAIGVLAKSFGSASDVADEFKENVKKLSEELTNLANKGKTSDLDKMINADVAKEKIKEVNKQIANTAGSLAAAYAKAKQENIYTVVGSGLSAITVSHKKGKEAREQDAASVRESEKALKNLVMQLESYQAIADGATSESIKSDKALKGLIKNLKIEVELFGKTSEAIELEKLAREGGNKALIDEAKLLQESLAQKEEAKKLSEELAEQAKAEKEASDSKVVSLSNELALLTLTGDAQLQYKAALLATSPAHYEQILTLMRSVQQKKNDVQITKKQVKENQKLYDLFAQGGSPVDWDAFYGTDEAKEQIKANQKLYDMFAQGGSPVDWDAFYGTDEAKEQIKANQKLYDMFAQGGSPVDWERYNRDQMGFWEQYEDSARRALKNTDELMFRSMDRLISGTADAFGSAIVGAESLGEAMKGVFEGALQSAISYFAELAIHQALSWALTRANETTAGIGMAQSKTLSAQSASVEAGLNAFASTAAIPVVGPSLAPAAAAAAVAATQPMAAAVASLSTAAIPTYDKGGMIPSGGAGIVSEFGDELVGGTMVYNGSQGSLNVTGREETARRVGGSNTNNITINSSGSASPDAISRSLVRALKKSNKSLDNAVYGSMNRGRKNGGKRFVA